jgi:stage III sporulation protein AF
MDFLTNMVKDLVVIGVLAAFCDMILPESTVKKPVQLVFGLYFMAVMLNPLITLWTGTDLTDIDFSQLGEEYMVEIDSDVDTDDVFAEAARQIAVDIEGRLVALYDDCTFAVTVTMDQESFQSVVVNVTHEKNVDETVMTAEIKDILAENYGVGGETITVKFERGNNDEG